MFCRFYFISTHSAAFCVCVSVLFYLSRISELVNFSSFPIVFEFTRITMPKGIEAIRTTYLLTRRLKINFEHGTHGMNGIGNSSLNSLLASIFFRVFREFRVRPFHGSQQVNKSTSQQVSTAHPFGLWAKVGIFVIF